MPPGQSASVPLVGSLQDAGTRYRKSEQPSPPIQAFNNCLNTLSDYQERSTSRYINRAMNILESGNNGSIRFKLFRNQQ